MRPSVPAVGDTCGRSIRSAFWDTPDPAPAEQNADYVRRLYWSEFAELLKVQRMGGLAAGSRRAGRVCTVWLGYGVASWPRDETLDPSMGALDVALVVFAASKKSHASGQLRTNPVLLGFL